MAVLAVPFDAVPHLLAEIRDHLAGKIVVDVTNPVKSDLSA